MAAACAECGLAHAKGELFVEVSPQLVIDTCQLQPTWEAAHAHRLPPASVAFHATDPARVESVLQHGLDPAFSRARCRHVALAETAGIAAGVLLPRDGPPVVLEVDTSGLDLFFELGEARHHGQVIEPHRLRVMDPQPSPDVSGWSNPAWRRNHSDCISLLGYPLSRRLLNAADDEYRQRWPYAAWDDARFLALVAELTP